MIRHLVAAGCSFSSNGPGGCPPTRDNPAGGCSYIPDPDYTVVEPMSWVGFLAQLLNVSSLVNVASASHGNILVANNIMSLLQRFSYSILDTLIVFNISDPGRLDIPCDYNDPGKSKYCDWDKSILPFSYLNYDHKQVSQTKKYMGLEQVEEFTTNSLLGMMSFLKTNGYQFRFMTMGDYSQHINLKNVLAQFQEHIVTLTPGNCMETFVDQLGLNLDDSYHPDVAGHKMLADKVLESL